MALDAEVRQLQILRVSAPAPTDGQKETDATVTAAATATAIVTVIVVNASTSTDKVQPSLDLQRGEKVDKKYTRLQHHRQQAAVRAGGAGDASDLQIRDLRSCT